MCCVGIDINIRDIICKIIVIKFQGVIRLGDCLLFVLCCEIMVYYVKYNEIICVIYCFEIEQFFDEKDLEDDVVYELFMFLEIVI